METPLVDFIPQNVSPSKNLSLVGKDVGAGVLASLELDFRRVLGEGEL